MEEMADAATGVVAVAMRAEETEEVEVGTMVRAATPPPILSTAAAHQARAMIKVSLSQSLGP